MFRLQDFWKSDVRPIDIQEPILSYIKLIKIDLLHGIISYVVSSKFSDKKNIENRTNCR